VVDGDGLSTVPLRVRALERPWRRGQDGRAAAGSVQDLPLLEDREAAFDQGSRGVDDVVVLALRLGEAAAFERDDHALACAGVGLVGEQFDPGDAGEAEEIVGAGAGQIVGRTPITGADPQQVALVVGEPGEGDRVVAVLVAPVPVDVCAPVGVTQVVDAVDLAALPSIKSQNRWSNVCTGIVMAPERPTV
jgi:hypothetical protein